MTRQEEAPVVPGGAEPEEDGDLKEVLTASTHQLVAPGDRSHGARLIHERFVCTFNIQGFILL